MPNRGFFIILDEDCLKKGHLYRMKKLILFTITVLLVVGVFVSKVYADEVLVNVDNLNIRSGPGTEYPTVGQANADEVYRFLQQDGDWIEVELDGGTGWVTAEYVTMNAKAKINEENQDRELIIQQDNTQLRDGPSTDYEIVYFAKAGEEFDILSESNNWYEIENDETTGFVYKGLLDDIVKDTSNGSFQDKTIIIDAGHGGHDVGAIGATGTYEKDFAYFTAAELEKELSALGANVLLTRPEDEFVTLTARASFSNISNADAFISIHYNSFTEQPQVTGIETFYYHNQDKALAEHIQREVIKATDGKDRGVGSGDLYVIRQNFIPAVLVELGFISNRDTEAKLLTKAYQNKLVTGIVNGLGKYFSE